MKQKDYLTKKNEPAKNGGATAAAALEEGNVPRSFEKRNYKKN